MVRTSAVDVFWLRLWFDWTPSSHDHAVFERGCDEEGLGDGDDLQLSKRSVVLQRTHALRVRERADSCTCTFFWRGEVAIFIRVWTRGCKVVFALVQPSRCLDIHTLGRAVRNNNRAAQHPVAFRDGVTRCVDSRHDSSSQCPAKPAQAFDSSVALFLLWRPLLSNPNN